ncbi:HNH endonuclease [Bifidobacterium longum]|uniref:HNH endonuclease n=1 Tax=Bifidobacterium longum TaxID=216816 RepID=UPI002117E2A2|nr:HNH endonuclease [Bifidobacterium longum]MEE4089645.1 HNH endonuclease [Bifidobacterium longum subsp. infantis]
MPCAICDRPIDDAIAWLDPMSVEVDEIIPVSHGGSATDLRNLEKVHRCCNQLKSDKSLAWARQKVKGSPALKPTAVPFKSSDW